jgi:enamine deaminase RidA (YjgF/YER057c/UK114 family)
MHRYSTAIRSSDLLFVSGRVGCREDSSPKPDFEPQVQLAFDNLSAMPAAAGCTIGDVVDVTTCRTGSNEQFETMMAVREKGIGKKPYPNWIAMGGKWLARLHFEIRVIARIPQPA